MLFRNERVIALYLAFVGYASFDDIYYTVYIYTYIFFVRVLAIFFLCRVLSQTLLHAVYGVSCVLIF